MADKPNPNETVVEIHLPTDMYDVFKAMSTDNPNLFTDMVKAVFDRDQFYGINKIVFKKMTNNYAKSTVDPKKTCDVGP